MQCADGRERLLVDCEGQERGAGVLVLCVPVAEGPEQVEAVAQEEVLGRGDVAEQDAEEQGVVVQLCVPVAEGPEQVEAVGQGEVLCRGDIAEQDAKEQGVVVRLVAAQRRRAARGRRGEYLLQRPPATSGQQRGPVSPPATIAAGSRVAALSWCECEGAPRPQYRSRRRDGAM